VDFHLEKEVESVDFGGHKVKTKDGEEFSYDKVIFATVGAILVGNSGYVLIDVSVHRVEHLRDYRCKDSSLWGTFLSLEAWTTYRGS
jgi:hypothetical protein